MLPRGSRGLEVRAAILMCGRPFGFKGEAAENYTIL
jgi:hypothetical protein